MEFSLQYKNKSDGFKDNKPEPNNNETEQYKLGTIFSSYNSLSYWVLYDILLSGNRDSFREIETISVFQTEGI